MQCKESSWKLLCDYIINLEGGRGRVVSSIKSSRLNSVLKSSGGDLSKP